MPTKKVQEEVPDRVLRIERDGEKAFLLKVPGKAKITFGPWSPPRMASNVRDPYGGGRGHMAGTIRIYGSSKEQVLAVFSNVTGYRDASMEYAEIDF